MLTTQHGNVDKNGWIVNQLLRRRCTTLFATPEECDEAGDTQPPVSLLSRFSLVPCIFWPIFLESWNNAVVYPGSTASSCSPSLL